ncbi:DUF4253 domain-containing protein [Actinoplanes derwentensis]|uniref:DUF4253 domain-containing protein n=1 Tax=Actinoplanes derwentensis TaxID=113562 RepID=A0A1H2A671_9ACTN|nr:DUF4253 domain-containing protein [Actinoplanes derwentensis]SDT41379.1 protein of unknown function [Actinoplanes derwentensis]
MAADADTVRKVLSTTMLADLPITPVFGDCLLISGVDPADVLPAWRTARAVMPSTGRRPVFLDGDAPLFDDVALPGPPLPSLPDLPDLPDEDLDDDFEADAWSGPELTELDRQARAGDPWQALRRPWWDLPLTDDAFRAQVPAFDIDFNIDSVRHQVPDPTLQAVNRCLFDRIRGDPELLAQVPPYRDRLTGLHNWYRPDRVELLLAPTTEAHLLAAWAGFHGTLGQHEVLAGVLLHWHDRWQADLVAGWETMLQFVVGRRPETADDACELAYQITLLAGNLEMNLWETALAVTRGDEWFLHDRP